MKTLNYWESINTSIPADTRTVLNEYLLSLKIANKAEATVTKYRWILEKYLSECRIPLGDLTSDDVYHWFKLYVVNKKPRTMDLFIAALSSFFTFCLDEGYMETMILKKRWRPRIPQSLPKYLSHQEYASIKRGAESLPVRNRALILFMLSSGCRISEVVSLNREDINLKKRVAFVKGKGNKIRTVHFTEECGLVLKDYLATRTDEQEVLFLNKFGDRLKKSGIYNIIRKLGVNTGLTQSLHTHMFRHTFATHMLSKGADLQFIADELGHKNLNTTRNYARIPSEDLIIAYRNIMGG
ncbi:tyrosine-type recombinase/integrase [Alkalihalophilus marmarensis]|uniref:tyrosine-type recombinase/integrase n=1 Tax=Alkalihalophilus marmarensis TaxID=521377 RepID=UPI00203E5FBC|nr:tyrosine-type recombinase/integrase [Alkalihalophilus marmarensis]MCM3491777.1 tyrosine-type recombinase/integrase [Alkalihalophilus marmarensis]